MKKNRGWFSPLFYYYEVIGMRLLKQDCYKIGRIVINISNDKLDINQKITISKKALKRIIIAKYAIQTLLKIVIILLILK